MIGPTVPVRLQLSTAFTNAQENRYETRESAAPACDECQVSLALLRDGPKNAAWSSSLSKIGLYTIEMTREA